MRISFDMPLNESQLTLRNDAGEVLVQGLKQEGSWAIKKGTCYHGPFEAFYDIKIWGKDNRLTFVADSGFGYFVGFDEYWLGSFCAVHDLTFLEDQGMCIVVAREEDRWNGPAPI